MDYLKEYYIEDKEIEILKDVYNNNIIKFLEENEEFVKEKLEYLKKENYIIFPIIKENIRIFLEIMPELKRKVEKMKSNQFSNKEIQMILMNEKLYGKI